MFSRVLSVALLLVLQVCGCAAPQRVSLDQLEKPGPPIEMDNLDLWLGCWAGSVTFTGKSLPEDGGEPPMLGSTACYERWLGGMGIQGTGSLNLGTEVKNETIQYWLWDESARRYRVWVFSDWGEVAEGWATWNASGRVIRMAFNALGLRGNKTEGHGTITFVGEDEYHWNWTEHRGPLGALTSTGVMNRVP